MTDEARTKDRVDKADRERLERDVLAVKNDIAALAKQVTDTLNAFVNSAGKRAQSSYTQARKNVDSVIDDVLKRNDAADAANGATTSIERTLEDAITQRPVATVAFAFGIGFLIGLFSRR